MPSARYAPEDLLLGGMVYDLRDAVRAVAAPSDRPDKLGLIFGDGWPNLQSTPALSPVEVDFDRRIKRLTVANFLVACGVVGDGVTDDTAAIQAAITASLGGTLTFPAATYLVTAPLIVPSNAHLDFQGGATLLAATTFTGSAVLQVTQGDGTHEAVDWSITGAIINGNLTARACIDISYGRFGRIHNVHLTGGLTYGLIVGSAAYPSTDINIFNAQVWFHELGSGSPKNGATSIGIHYNSCTDSYVTCCNVVGYRTGMRTNSGSVFHSQCHVWARTIQGPMTCGYYVAGSDCTYLSCYADSPNDGGDATITDMYGFYLAAAHPKLLACTVSLNPTSSPSDNKLTGVYFATGIGGTYAQIGSITFRNSNNPTYKFKTYWAGDFTGVDVMFVHDDNGTRSSASNVNRIGTRDLYINGALTTAQGRVKPPRLIPTTGGTDAIVSTNHAVVTTGTQVHTLPLFACYAGAELDLKNRSTQNVTYTLAGSDTLDGIAHPLVLGPGQARRLLGNGSDWMIMNAYG